MKWNYFLTLLLGVGLVAYLFLFQAPQQNIHNHISHVPPIAEDMLAENAALKQKVIELEYLLSQTNQSRSPNSNCSIAQSAEVDRLYAENSQLKDQHAHAKMVSYLEWQKRFGGQQHGIENFLSAEFEQEVIDPDWSGQERATIDQLFFESPSLAQYPYIESECRSSHCKVSIAIQNNSEFNQFFSDFSQEYYEQTGRFPEVIATLDPDTQMNQLFVKRGGQEYSFK